MKLTLWFNDSAPESINYFHNNIRIQAQSSDNIQAILLNEEFKKENLRDFQYVLNASFYIEGDNSDETAETLKDIETVEKALKRSFTLNDFNEFEIGFENIQDLAKYTNFLEKIKGNIIIHVDNLSKKDLDYLKNIRFQIEPKVRYGLITNLIDLNEFIETLEIVNLMESYISRFSLSEIEKQLLLFDIIRERIYKKGNPNDKTAAKDLNRVLKEEEIICAGYANIFAAVSNQLGIPTIVKKYYSIKNPTTGHATNVSYVYDSLYGDYYALEYDATWNSRKNEEDKEWINNYDFAAQPESLATLEKYLKKEYGVYYSVTNTLNAEYIKYQNLLKLNLPYIINLQIDKFIRFAMNIYKYCNQKDKVATLEQFRSELTDDSKIDPKYINKLNQEVHRINYKKIPVKDFIKMIYRVRRIEHSIDPQKYPLDYEIIEKIVSNKYNKDINLKKHLKDLDVLNNVPQKNLENKIKYDAQRMELLYELKRIANNKEEEKSLTVQ